MNNILKNITNNCYKIILFILLLFLIVVAYQTLNIGLINNDSINVFVLTLITIVYFLFLLKVKKIFDNIKNNHNKIAILIIVIFFILLVAFSQVIQSIPYKDLINVLLDAKILISKGTLSSSYLSVYSNNLGLLYLLSGIYKIANIFNFDYNMFAYIINALSMCISAFFTYLSVKEVSTKSTALTLLIYIVLNPLLYLYVTYYYTDFFVTPFMSIICYLLIKSEFHSEKINKNKFIMLVLAGLLGYLGYKIRATAIFIIIAVVIAVIIKNKFKIGISKIFAIFIGLILGVLFIIGIERKYDINLDNNQKFPVTHWIMMGNNNESKGQWNLEDYTITASQKNYSKKKEVNIQEIKKRIKSLTLKEYKDLILEKIKTNWAYGDSAYLSNFSLVDNVNKSYEYIAGNKTILLSYLLQSNRLILYILMILSLIYEIFFKKKKEPNFIIIAVFGSFLFYMLWEVAPRYSLSFIFLFILFIGYNYDKVSNIRLQKLIISSNNKKINLNKNKIKSSLKLFLILITIFCFVTSYGYYTKKIFTYRTKTVYSFVGDIHVGNDVEYINREKKIVQSFKPTGNFNSIILRVNKKEDASGELVFKLLDSEQNIIIVNKTNLKNIKKDDYLEYTLPKQIAGAGKTFYIELTSNISGEKLSARTMNFNEYDYIPSGTYKVNNKEEKKDLQMNINNKINNTLLSKRVYILVALASIMIELFTLDYLNFIKRRYLLNENN